jgi:hypothetical protein
MARVSVRGLGQEVARGLNMALIRLGSNYKSRVMTREESMIFFSSFLLASRLRYHTLHNVAAETITCIIS